MRAYAAAGDDLGELALVLRQTRTIGLHMPKMQYADREHAVLAADTGTQQAYQEIGILFAPAAVIGVEAVDPIEVGAPDRKIAGARAAPGLLSEPAQGPER